MRAANELLVGAAFGALGAAIAAVTRRWRFDWGLIWGAMALTAISIAAPRWPGDFVGLRSFLVAGAAVAALVAVTAAIQLGPGARTPLPFLISLLGIYATVPDTESALALLGVTGAMALAWRPFAWAQPRWLGAVAISTITTLAIVSGGRGRESSIVGALGAMAMIGLLLCRWEPESTTASLVVQLVLVGWWSRVAGRADSAGVALLLGLTVTVPVIALCWWLSRRNPAVTKPAVSPE